jgi:hypothetical protein
MRIQLACNEKGVTLIAKAARAHQLNSPPESPRGILSIVKSPTPGRDDDNNECVYRGYRNINTRDLNKIWGLHKVGTFNGPIGDQTSSVTIFYAPGDFEPLYLC